MPTGWLCPRCKAVHAPQVLRCNCAASYVGLLPSSLPKMQEQGASRDCGCPPHKTWCSAFGCDRGIGIAGDTGADAPCPPK